MCLLACLLALTVFLCACLLACVLLCLVGLWGGGGHVVSGSHNVPGVVWTGRDMDMMGYRYDGMGSTLRAVIILISSVTSLCFTSASLWWCQSRRNHKEYHPGKYWFLIFASCFLLDFSISNKFTFQGELKVMPVWSKLSEEARSLIQALLPKNPKWVWCLYVLIYLTLSIVGCPPPLPVTEIAWLP